MAIVGFWNWNNPTGLLTGFGMAHYDQIADQIAASVAASEAVRYREKTGLGGGL